MRQLSAVFNRWCIFITTQAIPYLYSALQMLWIIALVIFLILLCLIFGDDLENPLSNWFQSEEGSCNDVPNISKDHSGNSIEGKNIWSQLFGDKPMTRKEGMNIIESTSKLEDIHGKTTSPIEGYDSKIPWNEKVKPCCGGERSPVDSVHPTQNDHIPTSNEISRANTIFDVVMREVCHKYISSKRFGDIGERNDFITELVENELQNESEGVRSEVYSKLGNLEYNLEFNRLTLTDVKELNIERNESAISRWFKSLTPSSTNNSQEGVYKGKWDEFLKKVNSESTNGSMDTEVMNQYFGSNVERQSMSSEISKDTSSESISGKDGSSCISSAENHKSPVLPTDGENDFKIHHIKVGEAIDPNYRGHYLKSVEETTEGPKPIPSWPRFVDRPTDPEKAKIYDEDTRVLKSVAWRMNDDISLRDISKDDSMTESERLHYMYQIRKHYAEGNIARRLSEIHEESNGDK